MTLFRSLSFAPRDVAEVKDILDGWRANEGMASPSYVQSWLMEVAGEDGGYAVTLEFAVREESETDSQTARLREQLAPAVEGDIEQHTYRLVDHRSRV
jgi:hypothetical protein